MIVKRVQRHGYRRSHILLRDEIATNGCAEVASYYTGSREVRRKWLVWTAPLSIWRMKLSGEDVRTIDKALDLLHTLFKGCYIDSPLTELWECVKEELGE